MSVGMTADDLATQLGVDPTEAGTPTEPVEPVEPVEPQEPVKPTEPIEPVEPVEPTEPTEPTTPPVEGEGEEPKLDFRGYFDQEFGDNLTSQYTTDQQAARGLYEARKKLRERDETASWAQQVQQRIAGREQEFEAFLTGSPAAPAPATATVTPPMSYDQAQLLRQRAQQDPNSLTPTEQASLLKATDQLGRQAWDLSQDPEKVLGPLLEKYTAQAQQGARQATQQDMASMQEAMTAQQWAEANKEFVWVGGEKSNGFTPAFGQYNEFYNSARGNLKLEANEAHEYARFKYMQGQPVMQSTQPVKQAARRKPAVAAAPVTEKTPDEILEGGDFVSAMVKALASEKAARQQI